MPSISDALDTILSHVDTSRLGYANTTPSSRRLQGGRGQAKGSFATPRARGIGRPALPRALGTKKLRGGTPRKDPADSALDKRYLTTCPYLWTGETLISPELRVLQSVKKTNFNHTTNISNINELVDKANLLAFTVHQTNMYSNNTCSED